MSCEYCGRHAEIDANLKVAVCASCWKLLRNPTTALPLIRGHLTLTLRGKVSDNELKRRVDAFMAMISTWKRPG
jgi:hypothetical protein